MRSLSEKLDALELTDGERRELGRLLGAEGEPDDVEGFTAPTAASLRGADVGAIRIQGFELIPNLAGRTTGTGPIRGVVDHKADD